MRINPAQPFYPDDRRGQMDRPAGQQNWELFQQRSKAAGLDFQDRTVGQNSVCRHSSDFSFVQALIGLIAGLEYRVERFFPQCADTIIGGTFLQNLISGLFKDFRGDSLFHKDHLSAGARFILENKNKIPRIV